MDSEWPVTVVAWVQSQAIGCGICGAQSGMGSFQFFYVSIIPPVLHICSFIYHGHCMISLIASIIM